MGWHNAQISKSFQTISFHLQLHVDGRRSHRDPKCTRAIWRQVMDHPNIIKLYETFEDRWEQRSGSSGSMGSMSFPRNLRICSWPSWPSWPSWQSWLWFFVSAAHLGSEIGGLLRYFGCFHTSIESIVVVLA